MIKDAYDRQYYLEHKDAMRSRGRECYALNRLAKIEKSKEYYAANLEAKRAYARAYYALRREQLRAKQKEYYHNEGWKNYYKNLSANRLKKRFAWNFREANAGVLTKALIQQVYERNIKQYGTLTCYLCLKPILFGDDNLEHKVSICRGGKHELGNMDVAHASCNMSKGGKTLEEFDIEQRMAARAK